MHQLVLLVSQPVAWMIRLACGYWSILFEALALICAEMWLAPHQAVLTDVLGYTSNLITNSAENRLYHTILALGFTNFLLRQCLHESGTRSFRPGLRCNDPEVIDLSVSEETRVVVPQRVRVSVVSVAFATGLGRFLGTDLSI